MKNKRGMELTVGTIVVIILALVVLVLLILGFTMGWNNLMDKVKGFIGGEGDTVQSTVQACQLACTSNSQYNYCTLKRKVNLGKGEDGKIKTEEYTCKDIQDTVSGSGLSCPNIVCVSGTTPDAVKIYECTGNPTACDKLPLGTGDDNSKKVICEAHGCKWDSSDKKCTGTTLKACKDIDLGNDASKKEAICKAHGCSWL